MNVLYNYHKKGKNNKAKLEFFVGQHVRVMKQFDLMSRNAKRQHIYSKNVYEIVKRMKGTHRYKLNSGKIYPYSRLLLTKAPLYTKKVKKVVQEVVKKGRETRSKKVEQRETHLFEVGEKVQVNGKAYKEREYQGKTYSAVVVKCRPFYEVRFSSKWENDVIAEGYINT